MYFFKNSQTFKCLDLHCFGQKTMTHSDKGLAKIAKGASPRRHAETSPLKVKDIHPINNKLPPAEILCGDWKLAWYGPVIVPQQNPTLPWADIQCKVKWDRRDPKPQYRWSFPQINLHTVTTLNQYLHIISRVFLIVRTMPVQPLWVLGMRCLHLPVRALSKVLLLPVWVWLVLTSTAYSKGMLPLDLWWQASLQGLPERQHLGKTVHCWGWSDRIVSWVLGSWRRGWKTCTEWGLVAQWLTTDSCPVVTGHINPQRSPCWLPTTVVSACSGRRGGGTWQWPTGSMSSSVMSRDSNFTQ